MREAFFETAAPRSADLVLALEIAMGVGLLVGARLARKGRFRQHAWCQSAIVLLNLAVVAVMMIPSFRVHVLPRVPAKLGKAYYALATTHAAIGTVTELAGLYILLSAASCSSASYCYWEWLHTSVGARHICFANRFVFCDSEERD